MWGRGAPRRLVVIMFGNRSTVNPSDASLTAASRETTCDPPTVEARCAWDGRSRYWKVTISCPYCGKIHWHGGGDGPKPDLGHRNAHCVNDRGVDGYILVTAEAETRVAA